MILGAFSTLAPTFRRGFFVRADRQPGSFPHARMTESGGLSRCSVTMRSRWRGRDYAMHNDHYIVIGILIVATLVAAAGVMRRDRGR